MINKKENKKRKLKKTTNNRIFLIYIDRSDFCFE